jgi:nucleotide-binding universal stress UspA family protein
VITQHRFTMNPATDPATPIIDSVLHPTDYSEASLTAFHHALRAALIAKSALTLLHVATGNSDDARDFPGVRDTLERWGFLPKGSPRSAVPRLGIGVRKVVAQQISPVAAVLHYLERHPADLIVLATRHHDGRAAWLRQSVAEPIARRSGQMTLFIPEGTRGFVSPADGSVSLTSVLIPIAASPAAQPAVAAAARLVSRLKLPAGTFTLLHVGEAAAMPEVACPAVPGWAWNKAVRDGDVVHEIIAAARESHAGLVVMGTDGRHGFLDALRGSHSERVLRQATAPLLTVPAGSTAEAHLQSSASF